MTSVAVVAEDAGRGDTPDETPRLARMPALDGLRAISILAIVLYHGGVALPGGFLGVDIFFVISGFLITSLLLVDWERHGKLDLKDFWTRRARRLLPALFLVVAFVLSLSLFVNIGKLETVRADSLASLFYASNWWFIADGASYFDQFSDPRCGTRGRCRSRSSGICCCHWLCCCYCPGFAPVAGWWVCCWGSASLRRSGWRFRLQPTAPTRRASITAPTPGSRHSWWAQHLPPC